MSSVRSQTYSDIEHVVIDGGSTDGTLDVIRKFGVPFVSEPDSGIYDAMNKGINRATGELIGILNSDDFLADDGVVADAVACAKRSGADICIGRAEILNANDTVYAKFGDSPQFDRLLKRMTVAHPATWIRRTVYERHGVFSQCFKIAGDYEFLLRIWPSSTRAPIDRTTVKMLRGGASMAANVRSDREAMAAAILHGRAPTLALTDYAMRRFRNVAARLWRSMKA